MCVILYVLVVKSEETILKTNIDFIGLNDHIFFKICFCLLNTFVSFVYSIQKFLNERLKSETDIYVYSRL